MVIAISCAPLFNDVDPDGDVITPELASDAAHGTATMWGGSDEELNFATYMPDDDYSTRAGNIPGGAWVSDFFTYRVTDGQAGFDQRRIASGSRRSTMRRAEFGCSRRRGGYGLGSLFRSVGDRYRFRPERGVPERQLRS